MPNDETIKSLDTELVSIIQDFLLLGPLSWPKQVMHDFLKHQQSGDLILPKVEYPKVDYLEKIQLLQSFLKKLGKDDHPAIQFLKETAESYLYAYRVLQGAGTQDVSEFSKELYGSPANMIPAYSRSNLDIAHYFLRVVEDYRGIVSEKPLQYTASQFQKLLARRIEKHIPAGSDPIAVTVDNTISARAAAGSNYIKLRRGARFSEDDLEQLFHHEIMIHTLTYINGRKQPYLKTLGYSAPRTTATQEGLAVFAEYVTFSIELIRLKRIALRIIAIDVAENGADFIDLFRFYHQHGQDAEESYYSAMRIFRGGKPEGGIIFYKDNVYLRGLIEVGSFFKHAMHEGFIHDIALLFSGKLTTDDVLRLKPLAAKGKIIDPVYMPGWAKNSGELAAHLAINDLTERFRLKE